MSQYAIAITNGQGTMTGTDQRGAPEHWEGLWAEFRNFIRRFKGVSKHYLHLYVAMFGWMYNLKKVNPKLIQIMVLSTKRT